MKVDQIVTRGFAGFLVVCGLLASIDGMVPKFSMPGEPLEWFAASIAVSLAAGR